MKLPTYRVYLCTFALLLALHEASFANLLLVRRGSDPDCFQQTQTGYIYRSEINPDEAIYSKMEIPAEGFRILKMSERHDSNNAFEMIPKAENKNNWTQFVAANNYDVQQGQGSAFDDPKRIFTIVKTSLKEQCTEVIKEEVQAHEFYKIANIQLSCTRNNQKMLAYVRSYISRESITEIRYLSVPKEESTSNTLEKMQTFIDNFVTITSDKGICIPIQGPLRET